jgi:NAD(P)-dependent dehydrogenase (short-subunit alcohol dehydrogenase family)
MQGQRYGRFVFTSSNAGVFGLSNVAAYAAAKMGVIGLTNAVALEGHDHGILANAVMPAARTRGRDAYAAAQQTSFGGGDLPLSATDPTTVAALVVFLASEQCSFTHRVYSVTRGRFARLLIGVTGGWRAGDDRIPSAEEVAQHLAEIDDEGDFSIPLSSAEETELALGTLLR